MIDNQYHCPEGGFLECKNFFCEHGQRLSEILHLCSDIIEKIGKGDTSPKIDLKVERYAVQRLIDSINKLREEIESLIDLNHGLAIGICEHFEVLRKLQKGNFSVKASEDSPIEIVRMLGALINKQRDRFIEYIDRIKTQHKDILELYEQQNMILSSVGVAIIVVEEDMTIEFANDEFEMLTGYSKREIEGKMKWTEFFTEEMLDKMIEYHKLRRISPSLAPRQYSSKIKDRSGQIKEVLMNVAMIPYTKKSIASIIDMTERKKIEEQLIHSQKMESLGVLSGKIAHEFNNVLTSILGFATLLESKAEDETLKGYTVRIIESCQRAKSFVKNLLTFSRKEEIGEIKRLNLKEYLANFQGFIEPLVGSDIKVMLKLPEKEIFYKIEPTHLEVILMNLITNARDAMPDGGEITLSLKEISLDTEYHFTHPLIKPGLYVMLCVTDTGKGMDEETKSRIFEPFFTTKPKGKGTGLGLSTVFGLIKQYGGHIHVYSEVGKGTTFKIYLPQTEKDFSSIDRESLKGKEVLLVVDDETNTRQYIASLLRDYGYEVYEATNGNEALEIYEKIKDRVSLCLVDLVMPGMTGLELMKKLRQISPSIKTILMSGYPVQFKDIVSIEKTLSGDEILYKLREILNEKE